MKIAYGTYAMPTVPLEEAIPGLARLGYDGIEICIGGPKHIGSMPEDFTPERRKTLRDLLVTHNMGVPALFMLGHLYAQDDDELQAGLESMRVCAQLARDLGMDTPPVLAMGFGARKDDWENVKDRMVSVLQSYAQVAREEDFIVAGEAHCGAALDRSERIIWLLDTVDDPRIRLHFDIVHLFLAGEAEQDAVKALLPYTAHTHITDARRHEDGSFELVLLGDGELDATAYVRAMHENGWDSYITLEVSTMVWAKEGYDTMDAARFCYANLSNAFEQAGVPRG